MVDDHNSRRHSPISIEEVWATKTWEHRVFAFFLAITEVNLFLVTRYYYNEETTGQLDFRKKLAKALINNKYIIKESEEGIRRSKRHNSSDHELLSLPKVEIFWYAYGEVEYGICPVQMHWVQKKDSNLLQVLSRHH